MNFTSLMEPIQVALDQTNQTLVWIAAFLGCQLLVTIVGFVSLYVLLRKL